MSSLETRGRPRSWRTAARSTPGRPPMRSTRCVRRASGREGTDRCTSSSAAVASSGSTTKARGGSAVRSATLARGATTTRSAPVCAARRSAARPAASSSSASSTMTTGGASDVACWASSSSTTSVIAIPLFGASIMATGRPWTPRVHARRRTSVVLPDPRGPSTATALAPPRTSSRSACAEESSPRTGHGGSSLGVPAGRPAARRSALPSSSRLGHRALAAVSVARAATFARAMRVS